MIAVVVLTLLAAPPAWYFQHQAQQHRLTAWLKSRGNQFIHAHTEPIGPAWLNRGLQTVGLEPLTDLIELNLELPSITDDDLDHIQLSSFHRLQTLSLRRASITDRTLAKLPSLHHLQSLVLSQTKITDAGLTHLAALTHLQRLNLWDTAITDRGLAAIARWKNLKSLELWGAPITDDGLAALAPLTNLEQLGLAGTPISDAGLLHLQSLPRL